jgi:hypothetical protein
MIQPPTYPARPLNGGALDVALPKRGDWRAEPKYNGWRAVVHIPTGAMWNRQLERLSIELEFRQPLATLRDAFPKMAWADCEALSRRHALGKGTLILLDLIDNGWPYIARRRWMLARVRELPIREQPKTDCLYLPPSYSDAQLAWDEARDANKAFGCEFYEGIVAKRADAPYPIQRNNASKETTAWIKHRWKS